MTPSPSPRPLADTAAVADLMRLFEQNVRTTPTTDVSFDERVLRARLVLEEALEFVAAMGCEAEITGPGRAKVSLIPGAGIDLVEAADALADIVVVTKGSAHTLGIPVDEVFDVVHVTNMAKAGPDGRLVRDAGGKVLKPEGWAPPTDAIRDLLVSKGADL